MSDLLSIAQSGVRTYGRTLEIVADNVANASTPGYVRRTTTLSALNQGGNASPYDLDLGSGSGVLLTSVNRAIDLLQLDTLRRAESDLSSHDTSNRWLQSIEHSLTGPNALDAPIDKVFSALSDLASDPANPAIREAFMLSADTLADSFNRVAETLDILDTDLISEAKIEVRTMNDLANALADVNGRLRRAPAGSSARTALEDERDKALSYLSTIATVHVQLDGHGQATVRIPDPGGPALVEGQTPQTARLVTTGLGVQLRVGPQGADEPATLMGGTLSGLSAGRQALSQTRQRVDELADRMATEFNRVHQQGVDKNGTAGLALFDAQRPMAAPASANGGNARITVEGDLPDTMSLMYDGTNWVLSRDDLGGSITGPLPLTLDGVTVEGLGTPRTGDLFRIAERTGAAAIRLAVTDPALLATAPRFTIEPAQANIGAGSLEVRLEAPLSPPLAPPSVAPYSVTLALNGQVEIRDANAVLLGSGAPGDWIMADGFSVRVTGSAAPEDSFRIANTGPSSSSNGNALALLALREEGGVSGTIGDQQDILVSRVAVSLRAGNDRADIARASRNQAAESLNHASGVDLDDEAGEMLRLQQAYTANARIIQTAREIFETLLNSSR